MKPDIKAFEQFLLGCFLGLAIGVVLMLLVSLMGCAYGSTVGTDAGEDTAIHEAVIPMDAGTDTQPDAHDICCVIEPAKSGCGEELRGCVFTCGKAANGLTDVPWLCGRSPTATLFGCQQCQYGFWCHTVDGDGVVSPCQ